jgi:predicted Fe-Mo cluster-binding NifX family protein
MPPHAAGMFQQMGIPVVLGATGDAEQVLKDYLAGTLKLTTERLDAGGSCEHA